MTYQIRRVSIHSAPVLRLLELYTYEHIGIYGSPDPDPAGQLQAHNAIANVLFDGVPEVAMCAITFDGPDGAAVLRRMFTRWEHRNRGHARSLLSKAEEDAFKFGAPRLLLETGVQAPNALALYRSEGFSEVEPFGFYKDAEDSVFLGKDLHA